MYQELFAVPNHLTEQIGDDFQKLYPGANILVATKKDFKKENRQQLFVLLQCAAVSGSTARASELHRRHPLLLFRLLGTGRVAPQAAGHMGRGRELRPI